MTFLKVVMKAYYYSVFLNIVFGFVYRLRHP